MDLVKTCKECGKEFKPKRRDREYCSQSCSNKMIARNREKKKLEGKATTVWSCGGGVESTAMAALIYTGALPKPDYAVMTNNGWEKQSTWDYVKSILTPKLANAGVKLHIIKTTDYTDNRLVDKGGYILIPAFQADGTKKGVRFRTSCNALWKVRPVRNWLREKGVRKCENWVGISAEEQHRMREPDKKWFQHRYPLVELGLGRDDCLQLIESLGWPQPPKTSCVMCPMQDDMGWLTMKRDYPSDWARALEVERELQSIKDGVFLHNSLRPLDEVFGG